MIAFAFSREGPTRKSRAFIILGAIFNLSNYLPLFVWAKYLPGKEHFIKKITVYR